MSKSKLIANDPDALIDERKVSKWFGISLSKLRNDRYYRIGLPFVKIGSSVRYRVNDCLEYIENNRVETVPQEGHSK